MKDINAILVPTDFTEHADHALLHAIAIAERTGATIHLLHAVTLQGLEAPGVEPFPDVDALQRRADRLADERHGDGSAHRRSKQIDIIKAMTRAFSAHDAIVDYAERKSIDLIVIATRGHRGVSRALLGSVTERVLRCAPCPVLVVDKASRGCVDPDTLQMKVERVVVADNLTDESARACREALAFLALDRPEVHLVHAVETEVPPVYAMVGVESVFNIYPDLEKKLCDLLEERADELVPKGWTRVRKVREGRPHVVVSEYAAEIDASLLVVAAETRIDLEERLLGGTTERIVRHAPCAALVI